MTEQGLPEGVEKAGDLVDSITRAMMEQFRRKVSVEAAAHVLWFFGDRDLGQEPGGFVSRLLEAMAHADGPNLERIANEFQELTFAFTQARDEADGMEWLREKVRRRSLVEAVDAAEAELAARGGDTHEANLAALRDEQERERAFRGSYDGGRLG